jgi:hypothetical protein
MSWNVLTYYLKVTFKRPRKTKKIFVQGIQVPAKHLNRHLKKPDKLMRLVHFSSENKVSIRKRFHEKG